MVRVLARLLLSVALVFQGMAGACASTPMSNGGHADMAAGPATMAAMDSKGDCAGCPACPDTPPQHGSCMHACSMPVGLVSMVVFAPHVLPSQNVATVADASPGQSVQAPPTPPPIA